MIQVLALRDMNTAGRKAEVWFERGIRAGSVEEILQKPVEELFGSKVEKSEYWNIYYTIADCDEAPPDRAKGEKGRRLVSQHHIPFDIDKIEVPKLSGGGGIDKKALLRLAKIVTDAIGVRFEETGVVFSGNGLQLIVGTSEPIVETSYFERARPHYKAILDRINLALRQNKFEGEADPAVWSPARLMRMPGTENRKPNKQTRLSEVLQPHIERIPFRLEEASKLVRVEEREQISETVLKSFPEPDTKTILNPTDGCKFLSWCQVKPSEVSESEWYAMLSITARCPDGRKLSHKMSEGYPGYSYEETDLKIEQALQGSGPRTCKNIFGVSKGKCLSLGCKHYNSKLASPILIEGPDHVKTAKMGFYHYTVNKETGETKRGAPDYDGLVKWFGREHTYVNIADLKKIYIFNGRFFEAMATDDIERYAENHFDPKPLIKQRSEFKAKLYLTESKPQDWLDASIEGRMNFQNGVLDVRSGIFHAHSPAFGFRSILPCDYDPQAQCPRFDQFIKEVTKDRDDLAAILQEFMGYIFANGECKYQKALLLVGSGENGKSKFVELVRALASGSQGASALSVKAMESEQNRAMVVGKLVNIAEENSRNSFRETELIKNFISGGEIMVKSVYEKPFQYLNRTKLVMLCNELPQTIDVTHGFFRRLLVIPFDQLFSDELGNKDVDISEKLVLELPGIFNWAMEGFKRLEKQGRFTESMHSKVLLEEYRDTADTVHYWIKENIEFDPDGSHELNRQEIYNAYKRDTENSGGRANPSHVLYKALRTLVKKHGQKMTEQKRRHDGIRIWMMNHIRYANPPEY